MAQAIIDFNPTGGLAPRFYGDKPYSSARPQDRIIGGANQYADGEVTPFSKYGYLVPASGTKRATTLSFDAIPTCSSSSFVSGGSVSGQTLTYSGYPLFGIDNRTSTTDSKIYLLSSALADATITRTLTVTQSTKYPKIVDIQNYMVNGAHKVFYLWHAQSVGSTEVNVGIADVDLQNPDSDWMSTAPTNALAPRDTSRQLVLADNALLYVLDGNTIHSIDGSRSGGGTNGIVNRRVITFLGDNDGTNYNPISIITDAVDNKKKLWIGLHVFNNNGYYPERFTKNANFTNTPDEVGVYLWDRASTIASSSDFVRLEGVQTLLFLYRLQGTTYLFDISTEGYTELRGWNGNSFEIVEVLGKNAYPRYKDSVSVNGDVMTWLGADGVLYAYGRVLKGQNGLHKIGNMNNAVASGKTYSKSGAILCANGTETNTSGYDTNPEGYFITFTDTEGTVYVKKFYPTAFEVAQSSQYPSTTTYYSLVRLLPKLSHIHRITVFFPAVAGSSGSDTVATITAYVNQSSTAIKSVAVTKTDAARGYVTIEIHKPDINAVQLGITWSGSVALKDTITPTYAQIDYDETDKIK